MEIFPINILVASFGHSYVFGLPVYIRNTTEAIVRPNIDGPNIHGPNIDGPNIDGPNIVGPNIDGKTGEWGRWSGYFCPQDQCSPFWSRKRYCYPSLDDDSPAYENTDHCQEEGQPGEYDYTDQYCKNRCWGNWNEWECNTKLDGRCTTVVRSRFCNCAKGEWKPVETMGMPVNWQGCWDIGGLQGCL
jgi:hypothetical protein